MENTKRNAENIYALTEDGKTKSDQILGRAEEIKRTSENSGSQAVKIFEEIKEKSDRAIEQETPGRFSNRHPGIGISGIVVFICRPLP